MDTRRQANDSTAKAVQEYLTFGLGDEEYGLNVLQVQEIRRYETVTSLPGVPAFVKGVVNLRGAIVPIIDLRVKFNAAQAVYDALTVVIVISIGKHVIGLVVDRVSDVISLGQDEIKPAPEFGAALDADYLIGLGTLDGRMVLLVEIEKLLSSDELGLVAKQDKVLAA